MSLISAVAALVLAFISRTMGIEPSGFCKMVRATQSYFSIGLDYQPVRLNFNEDFMERVTDTELKSSQGLAA